MLVIIAAGFALAELFAYHIEYQREAISFSASDVPAALALVFLSPIVAIVVRVVVSLIVIGVRWRSPAYKLYFNAALFAFETALAFSIVRWLVAPGHIDNGHLLVAIALGLMVATFVGSLIVSTVIACFEGQLVKRLLQEVRTSVVVGPVITMIATITLAPALLQPELVVLAVIPATAGWFGLQQYGRLAQHHRDLKSVHGFAGVVAHSLALQDVADAAVREASRLLRAGRGVLYVYDAAGNVVVESRQGTPVTVLFGGASDPHPRSFANEERALACELRPDGVVDLDRPDARTAIAVPIRDDDGVLGLLVVAERVGASAAFDGAELSRALTLAEHLTATLRRALLHSRMEYAALHDGLTGAPNRPAFENAISRVGPDAAGCVAVMMLDLDRFKEVNDTLGHHVGDRVLVDFTERIKRHIDTGDVFARFGGDEFAILVQRGDLDAVNGLADRIVGDSFSPIHLNNIDVVVTASMGIAVWSDDNCDTSELLRQADVAMYTAKREHTRVEMYRSEIDHRTPERLSLLGSLREALERGSLEVHYQPKVDLVTSTVTGAEALVRWNHPSRGWVLPMEFVQVAEQSGLITQLTDQVLTAAIGTASGWFEAGYDLGVSVNLSTHDLLDERLPQRIGQLLEQHGMPADRLTLEITESALLSNTPRTTRTIDRLDQLGVRLSLDDFGTGYSSLGYIRRVPVSELKVDQSFVKDLLLDEQDEAIVRSTIDLGHSLGVQVVAEGIENTQVLERLQTLSCDIGQGYAISRPLAPDRFATWLRTTHYESQRRASSIWAETIQMPASHAGSSALDRINGDRKSM
jgi:diguanylate cyclase (GGDEF)-like protein